MSRDDFWNGNVAWLSPKDIKTDEVLDSELRITPKALLETGLEVYPVGSLFIVARSGILKRLLPVAINRVPAAANQDMKVLVPFLPGQERYLQLMLRGLSEFILRTLVKTGTTVQSLKYAEFERQPFPIPPTGEQQRIVAKVDELMALCDKLDAARVAREATRDRFFVASFARLTAIDHDPAAFEVDARTALNSLNDFTTRSDQVKQLRQVVLNLAVRGKLVPNDADAEPASALLKRMAENRWGKAARKGAEDCLKGQRDGEFGIPRNWIWTRLGCVGDWASGSTPSRARPELYGGGITWLKSGELNDDMQLAGSAETVTAEALRRCSFRRNRAGDVLVAMYGATIGKAAILAEEAVTNQAVCGCTPHPGLLNRYLFFFILAQRQAFRESSEGGAQPNISKAKILTFPFPLPPLAEQHRIVAKIEELFSICARLESSLDVCAAQRDRLLDALVRQVLDGRAPKAA